MSQMTKNVLGKKCPACPSQPQVILLEPFVPMYLSLVINCLFMFISWTYKHFM
ncbi:hypothetical protein I79_025164 [Cricetulus griseus]|uniref:Uncharacterized protein n=1 Tax=Cricetulus griseus TaxID=10029 RepID=G3IMM4_CRIGR|nr:hypothetical protein I79_022228 [Cricetulus griseus]EGW09974.1 hypothetical protein I79_025164 [Cricetulus griseus]